MSSKEELFESLYHDYGRMVKQLCLGFIHGRDDLAQDLTQETYINVWKALDRFRGASSHKTWIYRIAINTCLKQIRKRSFKERMAALDQAAELPFSSERQEYHELYQAIGQLPEIDRITIMMVLEEMEYPEIANVLGISENHLRVKIHRIKAKLKKILENE
jgi:RNA polymerase sigma-70 factor (ECF subfamily)